MRLTRCMYRTHRNHHIQSQRANRRGTHRRRRHGENLRQPQQTSAKQARNQATTRIQEVPANREESPQEGPQPHEVSCEKEDGREEVSDGWHCTTEISSNICSLMRIQRCIGLEESLTNITSQGMDRHAPASTRNGDRHETSVPCMLKESSSRLQEVTPKF